VAHAYEAREVAHVAGDPAASVRAFADGDSVLGSETVLRRE
jgi:hypothetical protein